MKILTTLKLSKLHKCRNNIQLIKKLATLTGDEIRHILLKIDEQSEKYGFKGQNFNQLTPNTTIVEYSSPNIAKQFHAGHFRSTITGHAIANIIEAAGHEVIRINYLGDWGMQFAILSAGFQKYGKQSLLEKSPLRHLLTVYIKANQDLKDDSILKEQARDLFHKMEQGDVQSLHFWRLCCDLSFSEYERLYKRIGVKFDSFESESMYHRSAQKLLRDIRNKDLMLKLENGAEGMDISTASWTNLISQNKAAYFPALARSNGTSLYLTRDVAAAIIRHEKYNFDRMIYVTDKSQELHFLQLFSILECLDMKWAHKDQLALQHKTFGRVMGMKTRNGEVVFLEDILDEAFIKTEEDRLNHTTRKTDIDDLDHVIHTLGLSGLICTNLKPKCSKDFRFLWSNVFQSKGHTGINLQYSHSRLESLKRNCGFELSLHADCSVLACEEAAISLLNHLNDLENVSWSAYVDLEPSHLVKYSFQLTHLVGQAIEFLPVKNQNPEIAEARLLLFHCAQIVLQNCMKLLGMQPLEKM